MVKKRKFMGVKGVGSMDDAFFYAEDYLSRAGKLIGLDKKKNLLVKTEKELTGKFKQSHSGIQKLRRIMKDFKRKPYLDTKLKLIAKRMED